MYLIIEHDFDFLENNIEDARIKSIVGYTDEEIEALHWISSKMRDTKRVKGYDGIMYPWYEEKFVEKLEEEIK